MVRHRWVDLSKPKIFKTVKLPLANPTTRIKDGAVRYADDSLTHEIEDERWSARSEGHEDRLRLYEERQMNREPIFDHDRIARSPCGQLASDVHEFNIEGLRLDQMVRWVSCPSRTDIFFWVTLQANVEGELVEIRTTLLPMDEADLLALQLYDALKLKQKRQGVKAPPLPPRIRPTPKPRSDEPVQQPEPVAV